MNTEQAQPDLSQGSPERFGYSWARFAEYTEDQRIQFLRWTALIDPETGWKGKRFLDVGCGAGRNSHWAMSLGAVGGVSADVDEQSLAKARIGLARHGGLDVMFCSAYDLPWQDEFDIAFSIGVIHHLEHPERAVQAMTRAVKPGGTVLIWVYGYENMELYRNVLNPFRQALFSRLPLWLVRLLAHLPTAALWAGLRLGLMTRLEYLRQLRGFTYGHLHHIVFDQMLPRIANYWRRDEVEALMRQAGLQDIQLQWVNEVSWTAIGTKPAK